MCFSGVHFNSQAIAPTIEQIDQSFGATHPGGTLQSINPLRVSSHLSLFVTYFHPHSSPSSLQCCRAVVPSQLSRPVLLLPTGLMEWSSKIRGENEFAFPPVKQGLRGCFLTSRGNRGSSHVIEVISLYMEKSKVTLPWAHPWIPVSYNQPINQFLFLTWHRTK